MKKFFILLVLSLMSATMSAQTHYVYAVLVYSYGYKYAGLVDEAHDHYSKNFLRDEADKKIEFNNYMVAVGYAQSLGWEVPDLEKQLMEETATSYTREFASFLLRKEVSEEEWLQWIEKGKKK